MLLAPSQALTLILAQQAPVDAAAGSSPPFPPRSLRLHQFNTAFSVIHDMPLPHHALPLWQVMKRQIIAEQSQPPPPPQIGGGVGGYLTSIVQAMKRHLVTTKEQTTQPPSPTIDRAQPTTIGRVATPITAVIIQALVMGAGRDVAAAEIAWMQHPDRAGQFEINEACFAAIFKAFVERRPVDLLRARAFFDFIPIKNLQTYNIMIDLLISRGKLDDARATFDRLLESGLALDPASVGIYINLVVASVKQAKGDLAKRAALLQEAEEWWTRVKANPTQLLDGSVTCSMMKLYHVADRNNLKRQVAILDEALAVEASQTRDGITPPVYVDARCMEQLVNYLASNPDDWSQVAVKFSHLMLERAEAARIAGPTPDTSDHARELEVGRILNHFLTYFQSSHQHEELLRLWSVATPTLKRTNPRLFLVMLNYCAEAGRVDFAESIVAEFESLGAQWNPPLFSAWLECYVESGDVIAAKRIWKRMLAAKVQPNSDNYVRLLRVNITARHPGTIVRILDEMRTAGEGGKPITFDSKEYEGLIANLDRVGQSGPLRRLRQMAADAGVKIRPPKLKPARIQKKADRK